MRFVLPIRTRLLVFHLRAPERLGRLHPAQRRQLSHLLLLAVLVLLLVEIIRPPSDRVQLPQASIAPLLGLVQMRRAIQQLPSALFLSQPASVPQPLATPPWRVEIVPPPLAATVRQADFDQPQ
jgi:hypothetical protein